MTITLATIGVARSARADDLPPMVTVEGEHVVIERVDAQGVVEVCRAPCNPTLDDGARYRIRTLDAPPPPKARKNLALGIALTIASGAFLTGAGVLFGYVAVNANDGFLNLTGLAVFPAIALAAGGLACGIPGVYMLATGGSNAVAPTPTSGRDAKSFMVPLFSTRF